MYSWQKLFSILWTSFTGCFISCEEAFVLYKVQFVNCWPQLLGKWSPVESPPLRLYQVEYCLWFSLAVSLFRFHIVLPPWPIRTLPPK